MKNKIIVLLLTLGCLGCSDFLEESSQDEMRPASIGDMEELFNGEGYTDFTFGKTNRFTDDIECFGASELEQYTANDRDELLLGRWKYSWDAEMFDANGGGDDASWWKTPYERIKGCNVILDYIDRVYGDKDRKENLRGEALTMRAYYYLFLVNIFGQPYNAGDPRKNLAVPLKLDMDVTDDLYTRNTVAEVYDQIVKDLTEGDRLLTEYDLPKSIERINHLAAKTLLSRVYLYMENWDKAIEYATKALDVKSTLLSLSSFESPDLLQLGEGVYCIYTPKEIIWAYTGDGRAINPDKMRPGRSVYSVSDELLRLYERESDGTARDLRYHLYFMFTKNMDGEWENGKELKDFVCKDRSNNRQGLRVAELYLNRAEGYLRKFIASGQDEFRVKALADLNYLRQYRYDTREKAYQPVNITDAEELLSFYKDERRRELCGEDNHRWFDLRRYGMPELTHVFFVYPSEKQEYVLEEKSPRYVLRIPENVIKQNPKLTQNP